MPTKANEYWGAIGDLMQPREPDSEEEFLRGSDLARRECAAQGHDWPDEDGRPCRRCDKPSALPGPSLADERYAAERDALIPIAEAAANGAGFGFDSPEIDAERWNRVFHETMDRLADVLRHARSIDAPVHPRGWP